MDRRKFIKKSALVAAATIGVPYILPTGRLFAATGARKANHVVFCLYAGGVRNFESVQKAEGNLMPFSLTGSESISSDIAPGMSSLPSPTGPKLQTFGTLYKEFRFKEGPTGHFNGHTTAMTGNYTNGDVKLRQPPDFPTVFEYYRKHADPAKTAANAWWVSDSLGPYPYLNYSLYDGYGPMYGANSIQPSSIFNSDVNDVLGNPRLFLDDEFAKADKVRSFLDSQFRTDSPDFNSGVINEGDDFTRVQAFLQRMADEAAGGMHANPFGAGAAANGDILNLFYAVKVLEEFQPELMVVNMQGIDVCHTNFTAYCDNIRKADFALYKLWEAIQSIPGMMDDTVLIVAPEHGRNLDPNTILDGFGRYAIDHTNDELSRQIFCMVCGPSGVVNRNQVISTEAGESIDIVPTIADVLGFASDVPGGLLPGRFLNEAFV